MSLSTLHYLNTPEARKHEAHWYNLHRAGKNQRSGSEGQKRREPTHIWRKGFAAYFIKGKCDTLITAISMGVGRSLNVNIIPERTSVQLLHLIFFFLNYIL